MSSCRFWPRLGLVLVLVSACAAADIPLLQGDSSADELFNQIDTDAALSADEVQAYVEGVLAPPPNHSFAPISGDRFNRTMMEVRVPVELGCPLKRLVEAADSNWDGLVDEHEFKAFIVAGLELADSDGDGGISRQEWDAFLPKIPHTPRADSFMRKGPD